MNRCSYTLTGKVIFRSTKSVVTRGMTMMKNDYEGATQTVDYNPDRRAGNR